MGRIWIDPGKLMSVSRSVRTLRLTPFFPLLILCLWAWAESAQAAVGFSLVLPDSSSTRALRRSTPRGISRFQPRPIIQYNPAGMLRTVTWDSTYTQVVMAIEARGALVRQPDVLLCSDYVALRLAADLREAMYEARLHSYKVESRRATGEGLAIDLPYRIKSKTFRRLFGGDNVGVRVQGNIQINGNLRRQKFDEQQQATQRNTNTSFRIDMVQRFTITGKVGQKVEVKVDQDSERMFDFENSLKLTYTGDEDEIVKKVEAGNVSLNLGTKLATFSGRNTGLFGLKTEARVGALNLTGIASLERGQKNRQSPNQLAQQGRFDEQDFIRYRYFWLTSTDIAGDNRIIPNYRENYRHYDNSLSHVAADSAYRIEDITVYVSLGVGETTTPQGYGRAAAIQFVQDLKADTFRQDQNHQERTWKQLTLGTDYEVIRELGYIRLRQELGNQALACGFRLRGLPGDTNTAARTFGDLQLSQSMRVILLKPEQPNPQTDSTWNLTFRHVYSLGGTSLDPNNFKLTIARGAASSAQQETGPIGSTQSYLQFFRFDLGDEMGGGPNGQVDNNPTIVRWDLGELHFLDLTPFDPSGYFVQGQPDIVRWGLCGLPGRTPEDTAFCAPWLYHQNPTGYQNVSPYWEFQTEFKGSTSIFQLGPLVLEGSEEVTLNGRPLQRNVGYSIDYGSGELRILDERATAPGAALDITYESGRVFQLDKTTLLGARAEYDLWDDAYVGGMVLYLNQKTLDRRVRIGNEPIRNTLWDMNSSMRFKPALLSRMVEALPLVHTTAGSEVNFDGEVARVYPNPNSLENARTGDFNGLAFLDDFEGARRAVPLGLTRRMWTVSSMPANTEDIDLRRGRLRWYNPNTRDQVPVRDVFPEREVNSQVANTLQSLWLSFAPDATDGPPERSWAGVMRYLGEGYADQSKSQYLEFWIQLPPEGRLSPGAKLLVDLGQISEDALPNDSMDSEDKPEPGQVGERLIPTREYGNGLLDPNNGEDTGIDHQFGADPSDVARWNGNDLPPIPSWDDWSSATGGSFGQINGMERNKDDEGGGYPDTEDLNGNNNLDVINSYFSYTFDLSYSSPYIVGGQNNVKRWRLFRIPIDSNDPRLRRTVGGADLTNIRWARLYLTGFSQPDSIQIIQMDIVANEWLPVITTADTTQYVSPAVINTHENPGYRSPPGVEGEVDPITQLRQREQSLVLKINELDNDTASTAPSGFFVAKNLFQEYNLLEYKRLKMFVHGGDSLEGARFADETFQLIFRLAQNSDINANYYEIISGVKAGWDATNHIDVAMNELSMMNSRREAAGLTGGQRFAYAYRPDEPGDSLVIKGSPTLSRVGYLALGVRLLPKHMRVRDKEIWVDELRVSDIYKDPGTAAEVNAAVKFADLADLSGGYRVTDADFHNVNQRINAAQSSSESWRGNFGFNLQKFLLERWGFRLPLSGSYSRTITTPRVIPGTDTRINPRAAPDSIRAFQEGLQLRAQYSKAAGSKNPLVHYTLEPLGASWDYSLDDRHDHSVAKDHSEQVGAQLSYSLPTSKGKGVRPLWWMKRLPLLNRLGNPSFYYQPTRLQLGAQASKRTGLRETRPTYSLSDSGVVQTIQRTISWQFATTRSINAGFAPIGPLTLGYTRSHRGAIDSTGNWDNLLRFDFGRTSNITQTASAVYNPQLLSWLRPNFTYSGGYGWTYTNFAQENGQAVSNQRNFGTDLQLDLAQILGAGGRGGRERPRERRGLPSGEEGSERPGEFGGMRPMPGGEEKPPEGTEEKPPEPSHRPAEEEAAQKPAAADSGGAKPQGAADSTQGKAAARGASPLKGLLQLFSPLKKGLLMLDPITLNYDNTSNHAQSGTLGQPGLNYQFGFTQSPGLPIAAGYVSSPTTTKGQNITGRSGLKLTRDLRFTFSHAYRIQENIGSSSTGSNEQTMFWLSSKGAGVKAYPFVDVTADLSGLERISFLSKVTRSVALSSGLSNRMQENWQNNSSNVTTRNYTQQWNPLLGMNVSWKAELESNIRYSSSQTFADNLTSRSKGRQSDNQLTATVTYTFRTGFKLPLFFMRPIHLQNQTSFSLNGDYRKQRNESTETGSDAYVVRGATSSWSLQPRVTYTFSNTVQGQAYVQVQQTKNDVTQSKSRLFEFGIQVTISIRG